MQELLVLTQTEKKTCCTLHMKALMLHCQQIGSRGNLLNMFKNFQCIVCTARFVNGHLRSLGLQCTLIHLLILVLYKSFACILNFLTYLISFFRSTPPSRPNNVCKMSAHPSVKKFVRFQ